MRLLIVTDLWPHAAHSVRAANVVFFELACALAREPEVELALLRVHRTSETPPNEAECDGLTQLAAAGIIILPGLVLPPAPAPRSRFARALAPQEIDYLPEAAHREIVTTAIEAARADAVFIPWSEWLTALCDRVPGCKFAYYGNPPPKNRLAQRDFALRHGDSRWLDFRQSIFDRRFETVHLAQMMRYECLGNVAANDAEYYRDAGHPNAFYIRNVWIDRLGEAWRAKREAPAGGPAKIIGNIGRLAATANSHGLEILCRDVLPELRRVLPVGSFELHLLGAGRAHPAIAPLLGAAEIRLRGFVDDIDDEMARAPVFLCLNNASAYKVGHTRYLHAWSLGTAVVAHRDVALSMPELVDGENCLLGGSAAEIAEQTTRAINDRALRRRIGDAGYATFRDKFTADKVAPEIVARARHALAPQDRAIGDRAA